jgi:hypothetical protein
MKKTFGEASAFLCALSIAGGAQGAGGFPATDSTLYVNTGTDAGVHAPSQNFESTFDIYDAAAADDFRVPKYRKWIIDEVDVTGIYYNGSGPAESEDVAFYADFGGHPGTLLVEYDHLAAAGDGRGSFRIAIPKTKFRHGAYWVSVVIDMDDAVGGQWGWENMVETRHRQPNWQNPGGGFGVGCFAWSWESVCLGQGEGDQLFALRGTQRFALDAP